MTNWFEQYLQAGSPMYKKWEEGQEEEEALRMAQQQQDSFWEETQGQAPVAPQNVFNDALSAEEFEGLPPEMMSEYASPAQPGSGVRGGQMSPRDLAMRLMQGPQKSTRQTGGRILEQLMSGKVTSDQYNEFNPDRRASHDQFMGRAQQQAPEQYSNIKAGRNGRYYGMNRENNRMEMIPGDAMPVDPTTQPGYQAPMSRKEQAGLENTLRDDYRTDNKAFEALNASYNRIQGAQATGAGDIGLIFSYMKMLDPASTVREGEAATVQNTGGMIPTALSNLYNKAITGEMLTPDIRKGIVDQSKIYFDQAAQDQHQRRSRYIANASDYGLNSRNIVGDKKDDKFAQPKPKSRTLSPAQRTQLEELRRIQGPL